MYQDSLDAICSLLNTAFPEVETIYVNTTPESFKRPCFFVMLATGDEENLSRSMYQVRMTWQIVYFAPLDPGHRPDPYNQLAAAEKLKSALMDAMTLTGPDGTVYHILDVEGGPRENREIENSLLQSNEVYVTIRLEAEKTRPEPVYDLMQDIQHIQKL
ncbi:MAG: phage tail terminator family protein [Desulfotomaculales bacterium]